MKALCTSSTINPIVSIQGFKGSYHYTVGRKLLPTATFIERGSFPEVFEDTQSQAADFGIMAIENSIAGSLVFNYDLLTKYKLRIKAEAYLRIEHQLIAMPGQKLDDIKEVWSHPMAIYQCRDFLNKHNLDLIEKADTALSVAQIAEAKQKGVAAIASRDAAEIYDMEILASNIETDPNNYTRFLVLSKENTLHPNNAQKFKSSYYVRVTERPGGLAEFLKPISDARVNMSKIESRPRIGAPWVYDFYIDLDVPQDSVMYAELVKELEAKSEHLLQLGTYPSFGYI